jgi:hypothetical protein
MADMLLEIDGISNMDGNFTFKSGSTPLRNIKNDSIEKWAIARIHATHHCMCKASKLFQFLPSLLVDKITQKNLRFPTQNISSGSQKAYAKP